ncbi:unnamed protein product [Agarophyton chilense]
MEVILAPTNASPDSGGTASLNQSSSYAPLYTSSSLGSVPFDFEKLHTLSIRRLKLLKAVEKARAVQQLGAQSLTNGKDYLKSQIRRAERTHDLHIPPVGNRDRREKILNDEASHFLVRMALCSEQRAWLLNTEYDLFTARLDGTATDLALKAIEKANGLVAKRVSNAELEQICSELRAVAQGPNRIRSNENPKYYKIAFEEVPALVRHRKVFLRDGFAYVPESNILDVVAVQFRSLLSASLITATNCVAIVKRDERMEPILKSIKQHFEADEQSKRAFNPNSSVDRISLQELDQSLPAMPLCMFNMMIKLRQNHHLRHSARIQLGVFLKACGLTMEESLKFWRTEFGKGTITTEKFEKQYAYNIRHQYGKEGKRRNLPAFNCMKVINDRPGPGEHSGCPYRELDESHLKMSLTALGTAPEAIPAIAARAKDGNYQAACGMCFASSQPGHHPNSEYGLPVFIPDHPNSYFIEARRRRLGLTPEDPSMDDEVDDEELLMATEAIDAQHVAEEFIPKVSVGDDERSEDPQPQGHRKTEDPCDKKKVDNDVNVTVARQEDPVPKENSKDCDDRENQRSEPMDLDAPQRDQEAGGDPKVQAGSV